MPLPFRNPVNYEDAPEQEWTPPEYFTPSKESSGEVWQPPSYFTATEEAKKPGWTDKIISALKPAERIHPGGKVEIPKKEILPNPSSEERIKAANELKDPGQGDYFKDHPDRSLIEKGNINLSNRPKVKNNDGSISTVRSISINEDGKEVLIPTVIGDKVLSNEDAINHYKKTGEHLGKFATSEAATTYAQKLHKDQAKTLDSPKSKIDNFLKDVLSTDKHPYLKRIIASKDPGDEPLLPSTREAGDPGEASTYGEGFAHGLYENFLRPASSANSAAMMLGFQEPPDLSKPPIAEGVQRELPIRQADRRINPLRETTPQQDAVAIAQTRDNIPRTPANISAETGIPKPSVRRTIGELKKKIQPVVETPPAEIPPVAASEESQIRQPNEPINTADVPRGYNLPEDPEVNAQEPPIVQRGLTEEKLFDLARNKQGMAQDLPQAAPDILPERKPFINPFEKNVLETSGEVIPRLKEWEPPNYFEPTKEGDLYSEATKEQGPIKAGTPWLDEQGNTIGHTTDTEGSTGFKPIEQPQTLADKATSFLQKHEDDALARIKARGTFSGGRLLSGLPADDLADFAIIGSTKIARGLVKFADWSAEMISNFGGSIKPHLREIFNASQAKHDEFVGGATRKLFNSMVEAKGASAEQQLINKAERARRFAASAGVKEEGVTGAAKSLAAMRGEFEKVNPGEGLDLNQDESNMLFTAIKRSKLDEPEKIRARSALFSLFNGDRVPQPNELKILDEVFGKHLKKVSGPGASGGYDIGSGDIAAKEALSKYIADNPNASKSEVKQFTDSLKPSSDEVDSFEAAGEKLREGGFFRKAGTAISKAANTAKSMENAMSLAAPLRHGAGLIMHKEFYPAFADMFKFFSNKEFFDSSMEAIQEHPNYPRYQEAGGFFAKSGSLNNSEEEFLNSYVGKLPKFTGIPQAVEASQRGYVGFLNKLRFDVFNSMTKRAEGLGVKLFTGTGDQVVASSEAKAIAKFINNATGRGDLGSLNKMTNELNLLFWSPRMIASRVNMFANPKIYMDLPKGMRREGLKSLLGIASMGLMVNGLASLGGAKVGTNILSADFMKSRFGNKVIDPNAGLQQYVVGAARFLAGKTDSSMPTSRLEIAGRFLANKESPAASLAHTLLTSKPTAKSDNPLTYGNFTTQYGEKTNIQSQIWKQFTPIFIQDIQDLMQSEPNFSKDIGLDVAMGAASLAGMAQDYPEKKSKGLQLRGMKLQ